MRQADSARATRPPGRLPAGRHRIPDQVVREHQRDRLIEAISLLSAERGYANVVIADIVTRATVSKSTFYRFYRTKEECLFDAHKHHSAALIAAIDSSCPAEGTPGAERLRAGISSALNYLSDNPMAAHLLGIGILSCGPRGAHRYAVMIDALGTRIESAGAPQRTDAALAAILFTASAVTHTVTPREEKQLPVLEIDAVERFLAIGDQDRQAPLNRTSVG